MTIEFPKRGAFIGLAAGEKYALTKDGKAHSHSPGNTPDNKQFTKGSAQISRK
jgi:hypothetical protein